MISGSWRLTCPNYWRRPPLKLVWPSRIKGNEVGWDPVQTMARSCKKVRSKIDTFVRWMLWDEETAGWCKMSICTECAACSYRSVMWVSKEQWTFNFSQCAAKKTSWQLAAALLKLFRQLIFILHDTYGDQSLSMSKLMHFFRPLAEDQATETQESLPFWKMIPVSCHYWVFQSWQHFRLSFINFIMFTDALLCGHGHGWWNLFKGQSSHISSTRKLRFHQKTSLKRP